MKYILVYAHGRPLAVFELKQRDIKLTLDDEAQGLSYAKVLTPSFPLVVVANGIETRILAAHSGEIWEPATPSEEEFEALVASAARAATGDLKEAVSTLMGSNPAVWVPAVRAASGELLGEMSGSRDDPLLPFVKDFLFPRKATSFAVRLLQEGRRFLLIKGAPLVGKSSLLRELVLRTVASTKLAVLFVRGDEGRGVLHSVADLLSGALAWPVTADEARHWLIQVSKADGPALVLAVDGIDPRNEAIRHSLEDLSSPVFGQQLRIVVTVDDAVAKELLQNSSGREASAIGRRIDEAFELELLDNEEYQAATEVFRAWRMVFQHGADSALEHRVPWMLRVIGGSYAPQPGDPDDVIAALPAQLSLDLIRHTRTRFRDDELCRQFRAVAKAILDDVEDDGLRLALKLEAMSTFVVRRDTLLRFLQSAEIESLMSRGYLKSAIHISNDAVIFVRLPELVASEISLLLGDALTERAHGDATETARWLVKVTSKIPLGETVAAHAFLDAAHIGGGVPLNVIYSLVDRPPKKTSITPGLKAVTHVPNVGMVNMTFEEDGSFTAEINGHREVISADGDYGAPGMWSDYHPWLILSHLAGQPMATGHEEDAIRIDLELLGIIASCPHVLRRPDVSFGGSGVATHHIDGYGEVACHKAGIVEPITSALFNMLSREGQDQEAWIDRALESESLGLLVRIDIALREMTKLYDPNQREWAARILSEKITPALQEAFSCATS
ncbi:hypothetical protein [Thiorhodococcus minor]|uniref:Uncharacterized protein n=1 Tax=Thiorhodococcus minor TaxID=57489 RepID=A0A6M0K9A7_9GAMM|nr:hypothetical protein [Thiorhodococcus minor]NEV65075.1 hypothetical protein [Thiorhodococcus minor]